MICKDCEMESNKLNKKGVCAPCSRRIAMAKYKGIKYIPLKDIAGTREYKIAMKNRICLTKEYRNQKETKTVEIKIDKPETKFDKQDIKQKCYGDVKQDLNESFEQNNLSENYLNFDIQGFVETFYGLLQEDNYIEDARKAEEIFNNTSIDFLHSIEKCDWDSNEIQEKLYREKVLLELRRPTKKILAYYKLIEPIIDYIKKDNTIRNMLNDLRIELPKMKEQIEKGEYFPKQSNLMGATPTIYKKYSCSVMCYNLYGKQTKEKLDWRGGTWARSEADAKASFLRFIDTYFSGIKFDDKDILVMEENNV